MGKKSKTAIVPTREQNYPEWYQQVIRAADLAETSPVRGCMVIKPWGYALWEGVQKHLDRMFKDTGHVNAYFPIFIPKSFLEKEAEHVDGFAKECAVVTHHRLEEGPNGGLVPAGELEEPLVVRPTSETIIGHMFARWVQSYRDLPILMNQWANVVRWEMRTRLFLRTAEFLWQEGHTAHANHAEAYEEVVRMLNIYAKFAREWMAMPVVTGIKTESEKFAGALQSLCIEAMMQDGKALQAGTSHDLGQNFGKAFDVQFQNQSGEQEYVWQTSWGVSTRLIGGLIMTHSDDNGLVLPPKLAPVQAAIVPILGKNANEGLIKETGAKIRDDLQAAGISCVLDTRDYKPGYKYFEWEQKGVPVRLELGQRDIDGGKVMYKERTADSKDAMAMDDIVSQVQSILERQQSELLAAADKRMADNTLTVDTYDDFRGVFEGNESKFVYAHWDGTAETEAKVKEDTKATIRCIPLEGDKEEGTCMVTGKPSKQRVLFAKSY